MKKIVSIFISLITAFSLTACVAKEEDPVKASQSFPWIVANDSPADTVTGIFTNKFVEEIGDYPMEEFKSKPIIMVLLVGIEN